MDHGRDRLQHALGDRLRRRRQRGRCRGDDRHRERTLTPGDRVGHLGGAGEGTAHQPQLDHRERDVDVGAGHVEERVDGGGGQRVEQPATHDRRHRLGGVHGGCRRRRRTTSGRPSRAARSATRRIGATSSSPRAAGPAKPNRRARLTTPRSGGGTLVDGRQPEQGDRGGDVHRHRRRPRAEGPQHALDVGGAEHQRAAEELGQLGTRSNSRAVATPKRPWPPRTAQNSSGSLAAVTRWTRPSAATSSTARTWSAAKPCRRARWPMPPPRV